MEHLPHFSPRPPLDLDVGTVAAFERLYAELASRADGAAIDYTLSAPKWQLLCYLCDHKPVVLHGSGRSDVGEFEPRQSNDLTEFGNRQAVYAASDGIWPIYCAVVDRDGPVTSLVNACVRVLGPDGSRSDPHYFFSINSSALPGRPWRTGTIYVLPRATFEPQPLRQFRDVRIEIAQWASPVAVRPLARLAVEPEDFPFLTQIHAHDFEVIRERATRDPDGFPWLDS